MASPSARARQWLRFLAATVVLTGLYLALNAVQMEVVHFAAVKGWLGGSPERELVDEARLIAERSIPLEHKLPPQHRLAMWQLGLRLGYASQWLGGYGKQPDATMRELRAPIEPILVPAKAVAEQFGLGHVDVLPVRTTAEFGQLTARLEADEWGLADRVELATSARDRHVFQLGLHVGVMLASLDATLDRLPVPPSKLIGRHATLAGVAAEQWRPVARLETGGAREQTREAYQAAVQALEKALAVTADSGPGQRTP